MCTFGTDDDEALSVNPSTLLGITHFLRYTVDLKQFDADKSLKGACGRAKFQDQTLTSLKHGAPVEVQPLMTRVSEAAEESMADGDDYTAGDDALAHEIDEEEAPDEPEDEDEYGMDELGGLLLDVGPKSNTIALDFSQYLRVLEARKEEQRLIRAKGET